MTVGAPQTLQLSPSILFCFQLLLRRGKTSTLSIQRCCFPNASFVGPFFSLLALFLEKSSWQALVILIHAQTTLTCVSLPWLRYHHRAQCCAFWLRVLRLQGSLCSSETCLRHRRDNRLLFLMPQVRKHQVNGFFCNFLTVDMYNKCPVLKVRLCCLRIDLVTCFCLFDNLDLFSSGCFSRNGAGLLKGEASITFKTPSTDDVLSLELVTVCCFCVSGLTHFRHRVMRFTANQVTSYKFLPLSFFLLGTFGRRAVRQRGHLRLLIFKLANNKVDLGQIRSDEIVYC